MFLARIACVAMVAAFGLLTPPPARAAVADAKVEGIVTVQGKPIASGRVFFHSANGQFVGSKIKDGKYAIDRFAVGAYKLSVEAEGIPAKFRSEDTSGLTAEFKAGNHQFNIDIQR